MTRAELRELLAAASPGVRKGLALAQGGTIATADGGAVIIDRFALSENLALIVAAVNELGGLLDALDAAERERDAYKRDAENFGNTADEAEDLHAEVASRLATVERENARLREAAKDLRRLLAIANATNADAPRVDRIGAWTQDSPFARQVTALLESTAALSTQEPADGE